MEVKNHAFVDNISDMCILVNLNGVPQEYLKINNDSFHKLNFDNIVIISV